MYPKPKPMQKQGHLLYPDLLDHLNPKDQLMLLAKKIPWDFFEKEFKELYSGRGRPAKPIRLMVGLLLLKQIENLSDERVVEEWVHNPYYQAFCGEEHFQWKFPCEPSDLVYFRKRIGEAGFEKIFQVSIALHEEKAQEREVVIDTTVQEKNITFPTDSKLQRKVIEYCWKIAKKSGVCLRRSYRCELKKVLRVIRFQKSARDKKKVSAAVGRLFEIARNLYRDLTSKLTEDIIQKNQAVLEICKRILNQTRNDKHKTYSLHEPDVQCISKGKEHKKYEFGSKAAIVMTKTDCIIVGAKSFARNIYDGHTLPDVLEQISRLRGNAPESAYCDRGFRGSSRVMETRIILPDTPQPGATQYSKRKAKKNFGRRSAIEPVIGHLKHDFRLARNYLKGSIGDAINLLMAAAAFNFKKWMKAAAARLFYTFFCCFVIKSESRNFELIEA